MPRVLRILLNAVTALSLLLCVAAVGAWGWGRTAMVVISRFGPLSCHSLIVSDGELCLMAFHRFDPLYSFPDSKVGWTPSVSQPATDLRSAWDLFPDARRPVAGFYFGHAKQSAEMTTILLPLWFVVAGFALLPLAAGVRLVRHRRRAKCLKTGQCTACGYDCRATPDRCPECGRATTNEASR